MADFGGEKLKLYYFDLSGKGEPIRLALTYAGIPFEDVMLTREQLMAMKADGTLKYGQVPALEVPGGGHICQSNAILRYIGRIAAPDKIYPADPLAASLVDSILDAEIDLFMGFSCSKYTARYGFTAIGEPGEPLFDSIRKALNDEVIPRHLSGLEKLLESSSTPWIANTAEPSIADFVLYPRLLWLEQFGEGISADILKPFPRICKMLQDMANLPEIKTYYETHTMKHRF